MFGVLSYSVAQRSREIGIRTALGARPADIVALIVRQVAVIWAGGIAAGLWIALAVSRSLTRGSTWGISISLSNPKLMAFAHSAISIWKRETAPRGAVGGM